MGKVELFEGKAAHSIGVTIARTSLGVEGRFPQKSIADVHTKLVTDKPSEVIDVSIVHATRGNDEPVVEAEARLQRLQPATTVSRQP